MSIMPSDTELATLSEWHMENNMGAILGIVSLVNGISNALNTLNSVRNRNVK